MVLAGFTFWHLLVCGVLGDDGLPTWHLIPAGHPGHALSGWAGFQEKRRELQGHLRLRL